MHVVEQIAAELKEAQDIALVSHVMPDGDCIGSMLALAMALETLGKRVTTLNSDPLPEYLRFLPGADKIRHPSQVNTLPPLVVCVDCSDHGRLGEQLLGLLKGRRVINIDHHISNNNYGDLNYVDPDAAATGLLVTEVIDRLGVPLTKDLAAAVYTALVTDTGSFQYSNTSAAVHLLAARLIETGLDVSAINRELYETKSLTALRLLGKALNRLEISSDGRVAWITLPAAVVASLGAEDEHSEGIINFTRAIKTVEVGILFRELEQGTIKVGFRSKQKVDVNRLAGQFGGGGHYRAAGCTIAGELSDIVAKVVQKAEEFVKTADERHY